MTNTRVLLQTGELVVSSATIGYENKVISADLSLEIPRDSLTVIIGPNACGKSTLLKSLARVLTPVHGQVLLDGRALKDYKSKELARKLGLLPQSAIAPEGIRVADLVSRGRYPYHSPLKQWSVADDIAVVQALENTSITDLAERFVDELSGGQRQRVWIALLLAQQTPFMLLDEPTTYLDIAHQYEVLELLRRLYTEGKTVVAVLHDLNQASRYATHLIVMKDGKVVPAGPPQEVVTSQMVQEVFGLSCLVAPDPVTKTPAVFPY